MRSGRGIEVQNVVSGRGSPDSAMNALASFQSKRGIVSQKYTYDNDSDLGSNISDMDEEFVDPIAELGAFFIGINTQLTGAGGSGSDLTVGNDFRQISLVKNPVNFGTTTTSTAATLKAMKYLDFASGVSLTSFQVDELLVGGTSGAQAFAVDIDTTNGFIYYAQNSKTGYTAFTAGENITGSASSATHALASSGHVGNPEVDRASGQVLFLENRDPINRTATQNKCIVQQCERPH